MDRQPGGQEVSNEQLVRRIQAGEDKRENMARLYGQSAAFIRSIAWKYQGGGVPLEDLEQEGFLALYDAVVRYEPGKGAQFLTYAEYHIRARLGRYLHQNGGGLRLPDRVGVQVRQYERFCSAFYMEHGREPDTREAARGLGITPGQAEEVKRAAAVAHVSSLDVPLAGVDGGEGGTLGELLPSNGNVAEETEERLAGEQLKRELWACVDSLPEKQAEVIRRRYQAGETLREAGEAIGVNTEAVRQLEGKALRELRKPSRADRLRPFLPEAERIYNAALRGGGVGRFRCTWTSSTEREALRLAEPAEGF